MRIALSLFGIVGTLALGGCGGDEPPPAATEKAEQIVQQSLRDAGVEPSLDATPCDILSDALLRAHFGMAPELEIQRQPSKYSPHPLCTASWAKPDAAEIEASQGEAMQVYMRKKMAGEAVEMPSFRTTDEVTLTLLGANDQDADQAMASFEAAMKTLSDGITRSHKDVEVTFQADLSPVEDVGDRAYWAAKLRQLSVVSGRRIFHLTVNTGSEEDRQRASALARDILLRLQ